ncbi:CFEM domain-containing protein [Xylariomycetidae sp. FL2044]|nr:CFEM domain-containing protein [Xylariomycetidae sp. FL2044]
MKFSAVTLAAVAALTGRTVAQSALEVAMASFPPCALQCMAEIVPLSGCATTDIQCLCTNAEMQANITTCVTAGCTSYEGLVTKNVTLYTMCGTPDDIRDQTAVPLLVGVIGGAFAYLAFVLRMCSCLPSGGRLMGWDDYTIALTVAFSVPPTVFSVLLSKSGLGKDMWVLPPENIESVLFYYYLGELFYFAALSMNKISLLLFILRVFPDKTFQKIVYVFCAASAGYGISFLVATALQCNPIWYSWRQVDSTVAGTCNNIHLQGWMSAICNIVIDIGIIILPLKNLYALQIQLKKKLMIMFMFSLGIFVTIVSVIRLRSLIVFANTQNPTWDYLDAAWWSTVELHVGIICACLPAMRTLLVSIGVRVLGSSKGTSRTGYGGSKSLGTSGTGRLGVGGGEKSGLSSAPRRGDEGDFIPLVDVHKGTSHFSASVTAVDSYDSDGKDKHLRERPGQ